MPAKVKSPSFVAAWPSLLLAAIAIGAGPLEAAPQEPEPTEKRRSANVTRVTSDIQIDGVLDEPAWREGKPIGKLVQRIPNSGAEPSERTEVTLLYDDDNLYIGVECYDSEPGRVIGTLMARDSVITSDDRVEILLDTFGDQSNAFYFATNPTGAFVDGLVFANGQTNNDWDAIWNVRTQRTEQGWIAEFAIPFRSVSFPAERTVWGFNLSRTIQRKLEENRWTGYGFQMQFAQVSEAGEITGLDGLQQGVGLDVRPFVAQRWIHDPATGNDVLRGKPGLDLFYNLTPSLRLSTTVNTDFGETEVDARQINLTRFSIFFPEKRTFFLQDAGVFNFATTGIDPPGGIPEPGAEIFPFFSRRIGLINGQEVPIDYGVKLTGKVKRTEIGVLNVRTRDGAGVGSADMAVARVRQNFWEQSYVGAIATGGNPDSPLSSSTIGGDLRLATSNFLGTDRNAVFQAYGLKSMNEGWKTRTPQWLRRRLPERPLGGSGDLARDSGQLRPGDRLRAAPQRTHAADGRKLQPAAEGSKDGRAADVPRCLLHTLHAARQWLGRDLEALHHALRLALPVRRFAAQPVRHQPNLRTSLRAV
ncbi:MAG: sugar-binding protein [Bryobacterales bacterium]